MHLLSVFCQTSCIWSFLWEQTNYLVFYAFILGWLHIFYRLLCFCFLLRGLQEVSWQPFMTDWLQIPPYLSSPIKILQGTGNRYSWIPADTVWCLIPPLLDWYRFCSSESPHTNSWTFCGSSCCSYLFKINNCLCCQTVPAWLRSNHIPASGNISCLLHFLTPSSRTATGIALLVQGTLFALFTTLKEWEHSWTLQLYHQRKG